MGCPSDMDWNFDHFDVSWTPEKMHFVIFGKNKNWINLSQFICLISNGSAHVTSKSNSSDDLEEKLKIKS